MSERAVDLTTRASRQLDEAAVLVGGLSESDLSALCPDEGGDEAGHTVAEVAAHLAEGYDRLAQLLRASGYIRDTPTTDNGHEHDHHHGDGPVPEALHALLKQLAEGKASTGMLADLTDEQLDRVPDGRFSRFSDGRRTLAEVIDAVIVHQAEHLATLKRVAA